MKPFCDENGVYPKELLELLFKVFNLGKEYGLDEAYERLCTLHHTLSPSEAEKEKNYIMQGLKEAMEDMGIKNETI